MHPNCLSWVAFAQTAGYKPQALAEAVTVLPVGGHHQQPVRQTEDQHHEEREGVDDERHERLALFTRHTTKAHNRLRECFVNRLLLYGSSLLLFRVRCCSSGPMPVIMLLLPPR